MGKQPPGLAGRSRKLAQDRVSSVQPVKIRRFRFYPHMDAVRSASPGHSDLFASEI